MVALLLTVAAVALSGQQVQVRCQLPPDETSWGRVVGWTYYGNPDTIYLRYCGRTVRLKRPAIDTFAHELLHVEHPPWSEARVSASEHRYGAIVLLALACVEVREVLKRLGR